MDREKVKEGLCSSFEAYYNIKRDDVLPPFFAEAEFHSDDSMYFLIKAAKLSESNSNEYVYFAETDTLTMEEFSSLDATSWERGVSQAKPGPGHNYTDVTLIIVADSIDDDVIEAIKKARHHLSYRHMLWGFSNFRLIALELSSGRITYNRQGKSLRKLVSKVAQTSH